MNCGEKKNIQEWMGKDTFQVCVLGRQGDWVRVGRRKRKKEYKWTQAKNRRIWITLIPYSQCLAFRRYQAHTADWKNEEKERGNTRYSQWL